MLSIKVLSKTSKEVTKQIREIESYCKIYDKTVGNIFLDTSLNFDQEMNSLFLFYKENNLISVLSIFMPTASMAEISAYTLPEHRLKGYFKKLLDEAVKELKKFEQVDLLFVCEPQSIDGKAAIKKMGAEFHLTEYSLKFKGFSNDPEKQQLTQITLQKADLKDLEAIVDLSRLIFNDDYEDAKSMVTKSLESGVRTLYIAILDNRLIGMGAVSIENNEASIFGLGISPQYRGKGFGKELLDFILKELKNKGIQDVSIEVDSSNKNAFNLYVKCGFVVETSYDYYRKHIFFN